jgi:hypothetical protein
MYQIKVSEHTGRPTKSEESNMCRPSGHWGAPRPARGRQAASVSDKLRQPPNKNLCYSGACFASQFLHSTPHRAAAGSLPGTGVGGGPAGPHRRRTCCPLCSRMHKEKPDLCCRDGHMLPLASRLCSTDRLSCLERGKSVPKGRRRASGLRSAQGHRCVQPCPHSISNDTIDHILSD